MKRILTAAREGWSTARRVWAAYGRAEGRVRAQQIRLACMTDRELERAAASWGGGVCSAELRRRGIKG